jgi:hypothetical protein
MKIARHCERKEAIVSLVDRYFLKVKFASPDTSTCLRADPESWDSETMDWPGQASEHDADHGEAYERCGG